MTDSDDTTTHEAQLQRQEERFQEWEYPAENYEDDPASPQALLITDAEQFNGVNLPQIKLSDRKNAVVVRLYCQSINRALSGLHAGERTRLLAADPRGEEVLRALAAAGADPGMVHGLRSRMARATVYQPEFLEACERAGWSIE